MNYILDDLGYLEEISFGGKIVCSNKSCTEYNGNIPSGYETLLEWSINANIRAYKIIDGDLVYDENRDNELKRQFEIETEENKNATQKWVRDKFWKTNSVYDDELSINIDGSSLFTLNNAKESEFVSLTLTPNEKITGDLKINISNENMLENTSLTQTISGVTFTVNNDKTITLNGTSTEAIEFVLNGSLTNEDILFFLKNNTNYMKGGLPSNVEMNLYYYDGTDRELISSGANGTLNFTDTKYITCVSLSIESGLTFKDVKVSPMITIGEYEEKSYVEHKGNELLTFGLGDYAFKGRDYILIERENIYFHKFAGLYPSITLKASKNVFPTQTKEKIINAIINSLTSYEGLTIIQCDKDINFSARYFSKDYLNERFANIQVEQDKITFEVSKKANATDLDNAIEELSSEITVKENSIKSEISNTYTTKEETTKLTNTIEQKITDEVNSINLKVNKKENTSDVNAKLELKVDTNKLISEINASAEQVTINANKLNLNGYLTISNANNTYATNDNLNNNYASKTQLATNGSTIINGGNITTGTIKAEYLDTSTINSTAGTIGGWNISGSGLTKGSSYIYSNGRCSFQGNGWLNAGNSGYWLLGNGSNYKCLIGDDFSMGNSVSTYLKAEVISGNGTNIPSIISGNVGMAAVNGSLTLKSNDAIAMRGNNINITGGNGMMIATISSNLNLRSVSGNVYIQGSIYSNSSSKNMKENIVEFDTNDEKELYDCYKNMKIYNYDYKEKYGNEKNQIGFILEQIDEKLYKLIDGTQNEEDENIKHYNPTKLAKINTAMINILIKKIESLEEKLNVI